MTLTKKLLAGSAAALMLLPFAASAHGVGLSGLLGGKGGDSNGLKVGLNADASTSAKVDGHDGLKLGLGGHASTTATSHRDNEGDNDKDDATSTVSHKNATTTAAAITKRANRITAVANFLGGISTTVASQIGSANLDASSTASANAKLGDFNSAVAGAKTNAAAAVVAAGTLGSTTGSSTIALQAKADLKAAQDFLNRAVRNLHQILTLIFKA